MKQTEEGFETGGVRFRNGRRRVLKRGEEGFETDKTAI